MKAKKMCSILLAVVFAFMFPMNSLAKNATSDEFVVKASEAPSAVLEVLEYYKVSVEENSLIYVTSNSDYNTARTAEKPLSSLAVVTKNGNLVQQDILLAFRNDEEEASVNLDFRDLFKQTRAGGVAEFLYANVFLRATTSFESYSSGGYTYVRPLGQYFTISNNGNASNPSRVFVRTDLVGSLYSKSGSTYTFIQEEYYYSNPQTVNAPSFNTVYSRNNALASNRVIRPDPYGNVGYQVYMEMTVNGVQYYDSRMIYY